MSQEKALCQVCDLIWCLTLIVGCSWLVFHEGASAWWFVLAVFLAGCWDCSELD